MHLEKLMDEWWIFKVPDTVETVGPYDTKAEAAEDLRGLRDFFKIEIHREPEQWHENAKATNTS